MWNNVIPEEDQFSCLSLKSRNIQGNPHRGINYYQTGTKIKIKTSDFALNAMLNQEKKKIYIYIIYTSSFLSALKHLTNVVHALLFNTAPGQTTKLLLVFVRLAVTLDGVVYIWVEPSKSGFMDQVLKPIQNLWSVLKEYNFKFLFWSLLTVGQNTFWWAHTAVH